MRLEHRAEDLREPLGDHQQAEDPHERLDLGGEAQDLDRAEEQQVERGSRRRYHERGPTEIGAREAMFARDRADHDLAQAEVDGDADEGREGQREEEASELDVAETARDEHHEDEGDRARRDLGTCEQRPVADDADERVHRCGGALSGREGRRIEVCRGRRREGVALVDPDEPKPRERGRDPVGE